MTYSLSHFDATVVDRRRIETRINGHSDILYAVHFAGRISCASQRTRAWYGVCCHVIATLCAPKILKHSPSLLAEDVNHCRIIYIAEALHRLEKPIEPIILALLYD